ncbi:GAF domain-containing protein [Thalassotalea euphylliae]|uniref:GAF domain-containing protein n=1 Tax=Thalassotalea euphylliae TaxID=1655234 RepID=UPI0036272E88
MVASEARIHRLEQIFHTFIKLDKFYIEATSLYEYMEYAHKLLGELMDARNFYLASYNNQENTIQYLYNVDEKDEPIEPDRKFTLATPQQSPTAWVIGNKRKLVIHASDESKYTDDDHQWGFGTQSHHWVGIPLIAQNGQCLGAIVIQSYEPDINYSSEDKAIFKLFASIIASALAKYQVESAIQASTVDTHDILSKELAERRHAEKLQHALYKIASLAAKAPELNDLYKQVHHIIDTLIFANNFYIALLDEEKHELCLSYFIDEIDTEVAQGTILPIGMGLSSYVINTREPQLLTQERVSMLIEQGKIGEVKGAQNFTCWLGVPMISSNILHGIMVVQSYDDKVIFTQQDLELLSYVGNHVAKAIEATVNVQQRKEAQLKLAKQHRVLEQQHKELQQTLDKLKRTQQQLVQQEKMASLGGLVAGIAHEINTPLGICVTGVSHLHEETKILEKGLADGSLTEEGLTSYLDEVKEASTILDTNVQRAADLVKSFKQVAVDQSSNSIREICFKQYIDEILLSLRPTLKRVKHVIRVECDNGITANTNAGAISQIISNLLMNSIKHGFDGIEQGNIVIAVEEKNNFIILRYADDGLGIDKEAMALLFEPFYTTKRGDGGSGLGTHLVYNLVTSALHGRIEAKSELGKGLAYLIKFPSNIEE